jgi:hypothetical protein
MSLINRKKVEQLNLPVFPAAHEIGLKGFQGEVSEVCSETTDIAIEVTDQSGYSHKLGVIRALICDLGSYDMIMGMPSHVEFDIRKNYRGQEFSILNDKKARVQLSCIKSGVVRDAWEKASILPFITVAQVNKTLGLGQDLEAYVFSVKQISAVVGNLHAESVRGSVGAELSPTNKATLIDMLMELGQVFDEPKGLNHKLPAYKVQWKQDGGTKPFLRHGKRMTREEAECCVKAITRLITKGWIRPSCSAWGAPVLFVKKPNGEMRLVW